MRVYSRVVIDMATGATLEAEWEEYGGPVAEAKGGGSNSVDPAYNARMATIYEAQQAMGEEYMQFWRDYLAPVEKATAQSDLELEPLRAEMARKELEAGRELLPAQTEAERAGLAFGTAKAKEGLELLPTLSAAVRKYADTATRGVYDPDEEARLAGADAANAMAGAKQTALRDVARSGVATPGRLDAASKGYALETARAASGASSGARREAKYKNVQALSDAVRTGGALLGG